MQLKGHVAWQRFGVACQGSVQNLHTNLKRLEESLLLHAQHLGDALGLRSQSGIGLTHQIDQITHQLVEKRRLLAQLVAVADGPADDAALHVAAAFVARDNPIAH